VKKIILTAIILSSLVGCSSISVKPTKLPVPPPIDLPKITAAELQCVSDATITKLVARDKLLQTRIHTLEEIIKSTH